MNRHEEHAVSLNSYPLRARCIALLGALATTFAVLSGNVAAAWPEHEVKIFVNVGPGGQTDIVTRALARELERTLKQPIVVLNKPGAQSTLGPALLAKEKPNGYTIGIIAYGNITQQPHLMSVPYTLDDFEVVAAFGRYKFGVAVAANSPYRSMADLMREGKTDKGVAIGAVATNVALLRVAKLTGARIEQIPYKSGSESVNALLGGQVPAILQSTGELMPLITSGRIRLVAAIGANRWPEQPDVPTLREQGFDVAYDSWVGLVYPRSTPQAIVQQVEQAVQSALESKDFTQQLVNLGLDAVFIPGARFRTMLQEGNVEIGRIIAEGGLKQVQ